MTAPTAIPGMRTGPFALLLGATVFALALLFYFPTLGSSWAYDDIDYINQAADTMAGERGFAALLLRPQGEHIITGFRLVLHASLKLFGIDAFPYRLLVLMTHAASALFLGLLARRYTGSAAAGLAAGITYVGASGFSSMWVWFPSGATVPFAMALLTGGLLALAWRDRLGVRNARLIAGAALVAALFTESTLAPLAALPLALDEYERRRHGKPRRPVGLFSIFCVVAMVSVAGLASYLYTQTFGPRVSLNLWQGIPRSAFLLLVAPFRLFFPGVPVAASDPGVRTAILGAVLGLAVAAPVTALLLGLWHRGAPRLAGIAALLAIGPLGVVGLVGLGRWRTSYWELYDADRYFFTLLVPVSLLAGAVAFSVAGHLKGWPRRYRAALLLLVVAGLGSELLLHRRALLRRIPFDVYQAHETRFEQLGRLAELLEAAARDLPPGSPPLEVPDTSLWFPDVHNGHVTTRVLLHVLGRGPGARLRLAKDRVGERDARILNPVLDAWAREIGAPLPYLAIRDGRLEDASTTPLADFRQGPQPEVVASGFHDWEPGGYRWMSGRGELRLTLAARRMIFILATVPEALPLNIQVTAVDDVSGIPVPVGMIEVKQAPANLYVLDAVPFLTRFGNGRRVRLVLESDRTWQPSALLPGSFDPRDLSVQVVTAGCEMPPE
ncbi:MAG TPA: hypothetical protein VN493_06160 [Thermoanaerobaculia bacterium]|nr:hypothetical protein [Thermoanaerobaculia bacterium]